MTQVGEAASIHLGEGQAPGGSKKGVGTLNGGELVAPIVWGYDDGLDTEVAAHFPSWHQKQGGRFSSAGIVKVVVVPGGDHPIRAKALGQGFDGTGNIQQLLQTIRIEVLHGLVFSPYSVDEAPNAQWIALP